MELKEYDRSDPPRTGVVALYYGEPGTGKTFNALSFPGPLLVMDTENRCELVLRQQEREDTVYITQVATLNDIRESFNGFTKIVKDEGDKLGALSPSTIVIDSASNLLMMAQEEYQRTKNIEKIYPQFIWGEVYNLLDDVINTIRLSGHNLIFTAQMKDEFASEQKTGRRVLDIYKKVPGWCDLIIGCKSIKDPPSRELTVMKNGYSDQQYFNINPGIESIKALVAKVEWEKLNSA